MRRVTHHHGRAEDELVLYSTGRVAVGHLEAPEDRIRTVGRRMCRWSIHRRRLCPLARILPHHNGAAAVPSGCWRNLAGVGSAAQPQPVSPGWTFRYRAQRRGQVHGRPLLPRPSWSRSAPRTIRVRTGRRRRGHGDRRAAVLLPVAAVMVAEPMVTPVTKPLLVTLPRGPLSDT